MIDWNLHEGLVDPVGAPGLFLRPALRVIDMTEYCTLSGTVAMALVTAAGCANDLNQDIGNAVYVYSGLGVTPDDFDTIDPEPVATTAVTQNQAGDYTYETLLSPSDYTVAFTCQAMNDSPDERGHRVRGTSHAATSAPERSNNHDPAYEIVKLVRGELRWPGLRCLGALGNGESK